jgi:3-hydroxybutyryl-CoA dehydrogenase
MQSRIKKIGVVGAGQMGSGIVQVAAQSGFQVILNDIDETFIRNGMESIRKSLQILVKKGKIGEQEVEALFSRINCTVDLSEVGKESDFIIEAVPENLSLKKRIFENLDRICPGHTIFASNTSSLSITEIAAATKRPDKVIGMHFSNPVPVMRNVELIKGMVTSEETLEITKNLAIDLGKEVILAKDLPGFCGNRLLLLFLNEAFYVLMEGIATAEDIDKEIRLGLRHPMGPLELSDFIGLDTVLAILDYLHKECGEKYRPCPLLRQYVRAGYLGVKTGRGVFEYPRSPRGED